MRNIRTASPALGFMSSQGARPRQYETLLLMGAEFGDPYEIVDTDVIHPLVFPGRSAMDDLPGQRRSIDALITSGLTDTGDDMRRRIGDHLRKEASRTRPGSVETAIDVVSLALLEDMGMSPAWMLLMSHLVEGDRMDIHLPSSEGAEADMSFGQTREDEEQILVLSIRIGDGIAWNGEGVRLTRGLPETVLARCEGEPLRRVVSHPVLNRFDLRIGEARPDGTIDVGHVPYEPIDWR